MSNGQPKEQGQGGGQGGGSGQGGAKGGSGAAPKKDKRTVTIRMGVPAFFFSVLVLLAGFVWVFILGVIVGRGQNPAAKIVEAERDFDPGPPRKIEVREYGSLASAQRKGVDENHGVNGVSRGAVGSLRDGTMLRSGKDLQAQLGDNGVESTLASKPKPQAKPLGNTPLKRKDPNPSTQPQRTPNPRTQISAPPAVGVVQAARQSDGMHNYVYQVAAFKSEEQAAALSGKLKKDGIKASVENTSQNGTNWFKVLVSFRGTPEDTRALRANLARHGLPSVIMRSKEPAHQ